MGWAPGAFINRGKRPPCSQSRERGIGTSSCFTGKLSSYITAQDSPFFAAKLPAEGPLSPNMKKITDGSQVTKEGVLEKRGDNLLQLWKKKYCLLTQDCLRLFPDSQKRSRSKDLSLQEIRTVDSVERTGKYIYFTVVTTDNKEMDFRCLAECCWNSAITMALIEFKNKKAIQSFRSRQDAEILTPGQQEKLLGRAP
ncbi:LOW QUALITY PROTEIN: pleckstrin homology-like domain family A member 2 [Rhinoraja longicauda]